MFLFIFYFTSFVFYPQTQLSQKNIFFDEQTKDKFNSPQTQLSQNNIVVISNINAFSGEYENLNNELLNILSNIVINSINYEVVLSNVEIENYDKNFYQFIKINFNKLNFSKEKDFYDENIIYDRADINYEIVVFNNEKKIIKSKKFVIKSFERNNIVEKILAQFKSHFETFFSEIEQEEFKYLIEKINFQYVYVKTDNIMKLKVGDTIKNINGALIKIIYVKDDKVIGIIRSFKTDYSGDFYKIQKTNINLVITGGLNILYKNNLYIPDFSLMFQFPIYPFINIGIDGDFRFLLENGAFKTPINVVLFFSPYYDIGSITIGGNIGIGGTFIQNETNNFIPDSFLVRFSGNLLYRFNETYGLTFESGYYFNINSIIEKKALYLSSPFVKAGLQIIF